MWDRITAGEEAGSEFTGAACPDTNARGGDAGVREMVFESLARYGAATAEVEYDGYGDEGAVTAVSARGPDGAAIRLPAEVEKAVGDFVADTLPEGWEIDAGSDGVAAFDVADRRVRYSHYARYTEVTHDEWEG